jgi:hypothetical protein
MQARHPGLTILDGRHANYDPTAFVDTSHLNGPAAAVLSADLATILERDRAAEPAPGRWLDLPPYRPHPAEVPLEDFEQSRRTACDR